MKVLITCEESQHVCIGFRRFGHETYSCYMEPCSGGHGKWDMQTDVLSLLNGNFEFQAADGTVHKIDKKWDMVISLPPCTCLTVIGKRCFNVEQYGNKALGRIERKKKAIELFMKFLNAGRDIISFEGSVGIMSMEYRKPEFIIHLYDFGYTKRKTVCLLLKGLSTLQPVNIVESQIIKGAAGAVDCNWHMETLLLKPKERSKLWSKIFSDIAERGAHGKVGE